MFEYLDLSKNSFHGQIPQSLGKLISLKYLNLSYNFLSGLIPKSIANLTDLCKIDLSFNKLMGQAPKGKVFSNINISSLIGNEALCGAPQLKFSQCPSSIPPPKSRRALNLIKYILPSTAFGIVILTCIYIIYKYYGKSKARTISCTDTPCFDNYRVFSYHDLAHATNNFSQENFIGKGSFGSVFKGNVNKGLIAAIKVLNLQVEGASKSFDAECQALRIVRHRNLIKIISVCSNLDFKALVLEFMPNGNLEQWLYSDNCCLTMLQRLNMLIDVSLAIEHLHHHHTNVVLHCDLKPSNVLLDEEMVAHVEDFGIAKILHGDSRSMVSASTPGTVGYIAPEYGSTGTVSRMSDVCSFGILLLETFARKKRNDDMFGGESSFREWICSAYQNAELLDVVDHSLLKDNYNNEQSLKEQRSVYQCVSSIFELGLRCSAYLPKERILMKVVVPRLQKLKIE